MQADVIREQIGETIREIAKTTQEKTDSEKKRTKGEALLEEFTTFSKRVVTETETFDRRRKERERCLPECFVEYYESEISQAMNDSGVYQAPSQASEIFTGFRIRLTDLDDIISKCVQVIFEKESLLKTLQELLSVAMQAVKEFLGGE